jgi:hypothetical protein
MALAPQAQEFQTLLGQIQEIEKDEDKIKFLESKGVDPIEFSEVTKDFLLKAEAGALKPDTSFSAGDMVTGGLARLGSAAATLGGQAIEVTAGKETREKVSNVFSELGDSLDDSLKKTRAGKAISYALKETFDPQMSAAEEVGAFFIPFGAATKALNLASAGLKTTTALGTAAKAGTIGVAADVLTRQEDEVFLPEVIALLGPEGEEVAAALAINPDDSVAEKRLKQIADSALGAGVASALIKGIGITGSKVANKVKAVKKDKVTEPIEETVDKTPVEAEVVEIAPNEYRQRGKIVQTIGKFNTGAGRMFTTTAGMPKELFDSYLKSRGFVAGQDMLIQAEAKKLEKLIKKTGVDRVAVNRALAMEGGAQNLPDEVLEQVVKMRNVINENEVAVKDALKLSVDDDIQVKLGDDGGAYLTRTFQTFTSPRWSKDIKKALDMKPEKLSAKAKLAGKSGHNADVYEVVYNARQHLTKQHPELTPNQIDSIISNIVDRGKGGQFDLITSLLTGGTGEKAVKVLKGRKDIDRPILELMGEVKDPVRNFTETMRNQNKLIAKANYLKDVKAFAERNIGKEIKTPGLFPFLFSDTATFLKQSERIGGRDIGKNVGELAAAELGKLGGTGAPVGLNKIFTTDEMYTMLERGIDTFGFDNPVGKGWLNIFAKPAGVTQAMETVFDHTAHAVNTYGMLQQLAMNGNLLRPKVFRLAEESSYNLYQKAAKNDPEALAYLAKLKERGVLDSSVVAETVKRNLDRFGEGAEGAMTKAIKSPFRGASAVYGGIDDFGKMIAHKAEMEAYRKAFPNATDDEVFDYAAEVVRNTMPSYTTAVPAVRALSRMPFGTYATFPAEVLRTQYNIVKIGLNDVRRGIAQGNKALAATGLRRLSALGATTAGIGYAIDQNNEELGVTPSDIRGINLIAPEYQKNTLKIMQEPLHVDPKTGHIMTKFSDSGSLDAAQYIKGPIRAIIGRVMAGQDVTDREIDDVFKDAAREVFSPFISEKFLTTAILNVARNVDPETGRPIFTDTGSNIEQIGKELGQILVPGSIKAGQKVLRANQSEMLRGTGEGQTVAGFPLRKEDQMKFFTTGIRQNTVDLTKAMGYSLFEEGKEIGATKPALKTFIKNIPDKILTPEEEQSIYNEYRRLQELKKERMARLSDKVKVFRNMEYVNKEGKKQNITMKDLYRASTSDAKYPMNRDILNASVKGKRGRGMFVPDSFTTDELVGLVKDRKFKFDIVKGLKAIEKEYTGQPLRQEQQ